MSISFEDTVVEEIESDTIRNGELWVRNYKSNLLK